MNNTIKAKWIEALESGDYEQGKECLRTKNDEYCCLGVLCDLHSEETGTPWNRENGLGYLDEYLGLPEEVMEWAGLPLPNIKVENEVRIDEYTFLTTYNDSRGKSFKEIAQIIKENL